MNALIIVRTSVLLEYCQVYFSFVFTFCFLFIYDIAKIDFVALVVAQFANPSNLKYWILIVGIIATIVPLLVGFILDKEENKK